VAFQKRIPGRGSTSPGAMAEAGYAGTMHYSKKILTSVLIPACWCPGEVGDQPAV